MIKLIAASIEVVGIAVVSTGIGLELAYKADAYLILIGAGSVLVATGGMLYAKVGR